MGLDITDALGRGNGMGVDGDNRALTSAVSRGAVEDISQVNGLAFAWTSVPFAGGAGDTVLLIQNTGDRNLHVTEVIINNGAIASRYDVILITVDDFTAAGTAVVGVNLNNSSANVAEASAFADETANTGGNAIATAFLPVDSDKTINLLGTVVSKNTYIAVDATEAVSEMSVTIKGYFK